MLDAARWGCVAGSIMAEWQGVPPVEVLWAPLLQQAAAKHALLQAAGFEASALPQEWLVGDGSSSSSDAGVAYVGGEVQLEGAAVAVPAASSSGSSSSAVRSLPLQQHACGAMVSCRGSNPPVQQRQQSAWFCCRGSLPASSSSSLRLLRPLGRMRSNIVSTSTVRQKACVRL
jgi:hypothetical protein